jgi:hypothetical protein
VRRIKAGKHCLGFDEYIYPDLGDLDANKNQMPLGAWDNPNTMLRHDRVIALLPPDVQDVMVYILEWGTIGSETIGDDPLLAFWNGWAAMNVHALGAGAWSFGLQGNTKSPALLSGRVQLVLRHRLGR